MLMDATIVADLEARRVDQADAHIPAKIEFEVGTQRQQHRRHPTDKTLIANQT